MTAPPTEIDWSRRIESGGSVRTTLKAMVGVGLGLWLLAIALPGYNVALLLFAAVLVAWSVFHLLTDGALIREQSADAGQSVWQVRGT